MKINTAVGSIKINRDAKLNINQDFFIVQIVLLFLGATGSEIKIYQSIAIDGLATTRACERSGAWSERGAERAKYSWSAERVFIQRLERSLCLAPVPLRYCSHHEPRACTNPP